MELIVYCDDRECVHNTGWQGHYPPECERFLGVNLKEGKCTSKETKKEQSERLKGKT